MRMESRFKQSEKTHDGEVDGKKVQKKGTQGKDSIVISKRHRGPGIRRFL